MFAKELKKALLDGALTKYANLYSDTSAQRDRFLLALDKFTAAYGEEREVFVLSVPGRSEIIGNHTDHNGGKVIAGAIDRDIIAIAAKNDDGVIRFHSEGYPEDTIRLSEVGDKENYKKYSSAALIAGMCEGFLRSGYEIGGFDAYSTTEVLKGSGLSSSAAFEVMIGNALNHLYNGGAVENKRIAQLAQFAENEYFGKPCGLMDQTACAVGGFVYIDFADPASAKIEPLSFSLKDAGYSLCIVNTGGNHADLNEDYASVPAEMKSVASLLGRDRLVGLTEEDILGKIAALREKAGDRAVLRSLHFIRENKRVEAARGALKTGDISAFFKCLSESGRSSFEYLQNVYTNKNVSEQGLSLALAVTDGRLTGKECAFRVHGGGFAGTVQAFVKSEELISYARFMDSVFGDGAAMPLNVRPLGAVRLF